MDKLECWAIVELMGHVKMAGRVSEEERFGVKMGRLEIPERVPCPDCDGKPDQVHGNVHHSCSGCKGAGFVERFTTQYFGGGSVYRMTPVTEEVARAVAANHKPAPVSPWDLPRNLLPAPKPSVPAGYDFQTADSDREEELIDAGEDDDTE